MSIRVRALLLLGLVLTLSTVVLYLVIARLQTANYNALERASAERDLERISRIILADLDNRGFVATDYGSWDQTYDFVTGLRPDYPEENFSSLTMSDLKMGFVIIANRTGAIAFSNSVNLNTGARRVVPEALYAYLNPAGSFLAEQSEAEDINGFLHSGDDVVLGSVAPVLRSDDSGPREGFLFIGRTLDTALMAQFEQQLQLSMAFYKRRAEGFDRGSTAVIDAIQAQGTDREFATYAPRTLVQYIDEQTLMGHVLFADPHGQPILLATARIPRTIHQAGQRSLTTLLIALAVAGSALIATVLVVLDRLVLRRLSRLGHEVSAIGRSQDFGLRVAATGTDEFSRVGTSVNWMLEQLEISNRKLEEEHERAEGLLLNILPEPIAQRLKSDPRSIAQSYDEVSILFADLVGFTEMSARMPAADLVDLLNGLFSRFDDLASELGLEKIKTIGDAYMVVSGLPEPDEHHADKLAEMALRMLDETRAFSAERAIDLSLRVGINSGVVVAGVIGKNKFIYDLWGDAVNLASRMESSGQVGAIQLTQATRERLSYRFKVIERGPVEVKGRGQMHTYLLVGRTSIKG